MNHVYTVLWNAVLGCFCVVSELGRNRCRATTQRRARPATAPVRLNALAAQVALVALAWTAPSWAGEVLPQGGKVMSGTATIKTVKKTMTIQQSEPKLIVTWNSFDIESGHSVKFEQKPADVALNRVTGTGRSSINGNMTAKGQVFLVNPNGVLFGKGANVNVGGLVASTLNISNDDFMNGRFTFSRNGQLGKVVNRGTITATGHGAVALLGGDVTNEGTITARLGVVALAAGNKITLNLGGDDNLQVVINEAALNASVVNSGKLYADGGNVWMTANAADGLLQTVINNSGHISARTVENRGGKIRLFAEGEGAFVRVSGMLDASAQQGHGGDIEIAGTHVQILPGTQFTTRALDGNGRFGRLTVQGSDLHVSVEGSAEAGSQIDASVLTNALDASNVTLHSLDGDVHVDAPVNWKQNQLKLSSPGSVNVNSVMTASGTAALAVTHGVDGMNSAVGLNMALSADGLTGRIDFRDVRDQGKEANRRLTINGRSYALLTEMGAPGSRTTRDLQGIEGGLLLNYALASNIDATHFGPFKPLGSSVLPFMGKFEGLGHEVANLVVNEHLESRVGLFGQSDGSIRNVALRNGSVTGHGQSRVLAGSLVGELWKNGSITNVHTTATVEANAQGISAQAIAASIVGKMKGGQVSNAYANGKVTATAAAAVPESIARDPMVGSAISASTYSAAGGIAGYVDNEGSIRDAHTAAELTSTATQPVGNSVRPAQSFIGGAIGVNESGVYENVTAVGEMSSKAHGSTVVSSHELVGNHPDARRGTMDELLPPTAEAIQPDEVFSAVVAQLDLAPIQSSTAECKTPTEDAGESQRASIAQSPSSSLGSPALSSSSSSADIEDVRVEPLFNAPSQTRAPSDEPNTMPDMAIELSPPASPDSSPALSSSSADVGDGRVEPLFNAPSQTRAPSHEPNTLPDTAIELSPPASPDSSPTVVINTAFLEAIPGARLLDAPRPSSAPSVSADIPPTVIELSQFPSPPGNTALSSSQADVESAHVEPLFAAPSPSSAPSVDPDMPPMAIALPEPNAPVGNPTVAASTAFLEAIPAEALPSAQNQSVAIGNATDPAPALAANPLTEPVETDTPAAYPVTEIGPEKKVLSAPPVTPDSARDDRAPSADASPAVAPATAIPQAIDNPADVEVAPSAALAGTPIDPVAVSSDTAPSTNADPVMVAADPGKPGADNRVGVMSTAAAEVVPSAATAPVAVKDTGNAAAGVKVQSLAAYAAVMATIGSLTRAAPAPAQQPSSEDPLYTVIGNGIQLPAR